MRAKRVVQILILLCGFQGIRAYGQVVATWTDTSGNWSNAANWSTCAPGACPAVPANSGGTFYNVVINGTGSDMVTFDASGTVISNLTIGAGETLQNNGLAAILTIGDPALPGSGSLSVNGTINWGNGSTLLVLGNFYGPNTSIAGQTGLLTLSGRSSAVIDGTVVNNGPGATVLVDGSNLTIKGDYTSIIGGPVQLQNGAIMTVGGSYTSYNFALGISANDSIMTVNGVFSSQVTSFTNGSVLRVQGNFRNGPADLGNFTLSGGSSAVIGGNFDNGYISSVYIDNSSLKIQGNLYNVVGNEISIANSSVLSVNGDVSLTAAGFNLVGGSVGTVLGNFDNGSYVSVDSSALRVGGTFTNNSGQTILSPTATLTTTSYSQGPDANALTDVSGTLVAGSYSQNGGATKIEQGGLIKATTFTATGGTVTVNGILDPTAVEIGSGAALQGTGTIIGNVAMGGTITPGLGGLPGTLTITGGYEQLGGGIFEGIFGPSSNGLLKVNGLAALDSGSILDIMLLNGFNPLGDTFKLMNYDSLVGMFANGSSFSADGYIWDVTYGAHEIDVTAVSTPEPSTLLLLAAGLFFLGIYAKRRRPGAGLSIASRQ